MGIGMDRRKWQETLLEGDYGPFLEVLMNGEDGGCGWCG